MKKVLYILQTITAVMLIGCQALDNDVVGGNTADAVNFGVQGTTTRVDFAQNELEALTAAWELGDKIGISATVSGEPIGCNYPYAISEIAEDGKEFPVECQFCDTVYRFTPEDIRRLIENSK